MKNLHAIATTMRIPPQNIEAEQAVIGACLLSGQAMNDVSAVLRPQNFYRPAHQVIFSAMVDLSAMRHPVDVITVSARLAETMKSDETGGPAYLSSILDMLPSVSNALHYAQIVKRKAQLREMITCASLLAEKCYTEAFDGRDETTMADVEAMVREMSKTANNVGGIRHISEFLHPAIKTLELASEGGTIGIPTGYTDLDRLTCGFSPTDLIIWAGRPAMGKTASAMNMASYQATELGIPVGVISLEMSGEALATRMLCSESGVDSHRARAGKLADADWPKIVRAAGKINVSPLVVDDTPAMTASLIRRKARTMQERYGIKILYLDYLQIAKSDAKGQSRERDVADISGELKAIAKELNIPVVALSQLSRKCEERTDKRPMLSDLRDSGSIEQDADIIVFIYRDEVYNKSESNPRKGIAELDIAKQRNGPTGRVELAWDGKTTTFRNLITMHEKTW